MKNQFKVNLISEYLKFNDQLLCCLTETWLHSDHYDAELAIEGYTLFRSDRERRKSRGRHSGGVALYAKDDLSPQLIGTFSNGVNEVLAVRVTKINSVIVIVYRQPDDSQNGHASTSIQFDQTCIEIRHLLESLPQPTPLTIICGDFNLPDATWSDNVMGSRENPGDSRKMESTMKTLCNDFFLEQIVDSPTQRDGNKLDLLFTNSSDLFSRIQVTNSICSDHFWIECELLVENSDNKQFEEQNRNCTTEPPHLSDLNFKSEKIDWLRLNQDLENSDLAEKLTSCELNELYQIFVDSCFDICKRHIPERKLKRKSKRPPRDRRTLMRKKRRLLDKKSKGKQSDVNNNRVNKIDSKILVIEKQLSESFLKERVDTESKVIKSITKNPKYFFSYAKSKQQVKSGLSNLQRSDGTYTSDKTEIAELLSDQYSSVFSKPKIDSIEVDKLFPLNTECDHLQDIQITPKDISDAIDELSINSASGPDGIPAILLKNCKEIMSQLLVIIWRRSLDNGYIDQLLKRASITPIHKGGDKGMAKNYRPIALTSHVIKVFEKVLRKHIVGHLERNNFMNPGQHGFRSGRSCLSQLIQHHDQIVDALEKNHDIDIIYLDFAKAFDKVDHNIILQKLSSLKITGKIGRWIRSFLTNREQTVMVNGTKSSPAPVISGVPQGSVLGPIIFLILIGDIDADVNNSFVASFADDTRIAKPINPSRQRQDKLELQNDLTSVYRWADTNNMKFNDTKFEHIHYPLKLSDSSTSNNYYGPSGTPIEEKISVKDLGVTMDYDGDFSTHIGNTIKKSRRMVSWILRTFIARDTRTLITLYKTMVIPLLDYCSQLWSPCRKGEIQSLENVQRSFTRQISELKNLDYWERLKVLGLYSLERRRERYQIIYCWKIINGLVPNFNNKIGTRTSDRRGRLCVIPSIVKSATHRVKSLRDRTFLVRGMKLFNAIPKELRDPDLTNQMKFKNELDKFLKTLPDRPLVRGYHNTENSNSLILN